MLVFDPWNLSRLPVDLREQPEAKLSVSRMLVGCVIAEIGGEDRHGERRRGLQNAGQRITLGSCSAMQRLATTLL